MMTARRTALYRQFRKAGYPAHQSLYSAKTVARFEAIERTGAVWIETPDDVDFDTDMLSEPVDGPAVGVVGMLRTDWEGRQDWYRFPAAQEAEETADAVWGNAGYSDPADPVENPYVVDVMAETIRAFRAAWHQHLRNAHLTTCPRCNGAGRVLA